ncbi:MAG: SCO family protein [Desertimonas sp.]
MGIRPPGRRRAAAITAIVGALMLGGCGDDDAELIGFTRDPAPQVDIVDLPDLAGGAPFALRAPAGGLLVAYFGYTHCPDVCPTTMADIGGALRRLPPDQAHRVEVAMVTVDPDRDLDTLGDYVRSFVADGHALGTTDPAVLAAAAEPFGVTYHVAPGPGGDIEVSHSTQSYVVDDAGRLVLTWTFGTSAADMAADLGQLLDQR